MRTIKKEKNGYYYADVSIWDVLNWGGLGVCDMCGKTLGVKGNVGKLVWVLSSCTCNKCFDEWQTRAKKYDEDLALQKLHARKWYERYLGKELKFDD